MNSILALSLVTVITALTPFASKIVDYFIEKSKSENSEKEFRLKEQSNNYSHDLKYVQNLFENYIINTIDLINSTDNDVLDEKQLKSEALAIMYSSENTSIVIRNFGAVLHDNIHETPRVSLLSGLTETVIPAISEQVSNSKVSLE